MKQRDADKPTRVYPAAGGEGSGQESVEAVILGVHRELLLRDCDAKEQLVGYLLSGDPTYITGSGARSAISRIDRNELLAELVSFYLAHRAGGQR